MTSKEIGEILRQRRKEKGMTQQVVAKYLNINRQAVISIESGKRKISLMEYMLLAELFNQNPLLSDTNIASKIDKYYKKHLRTLAIAVINEIAERLKI